MKASFYVNLAEVFILRQNIKNTLNIRYGIFIKYYLRIQGLVINTASKILISLPIRYQNNSTNIRRMARFDNATIF